MTDNALLRSVWCRENIERAAVGMYHRGPSLYARVIYEMKYARRPRLAKDTVRYLLQQPFLHEFCARHDVIVPVPTTWWRRWMRGYNPAEVIAGAIADGCGVRMMSDALYRRAGRRQSRTHGEERISMDGLRFRMEHTSGIAPDSRILLVDDVSTTGTTLSACAMAMRKALPEAVIDVFTLAWAGE